MYNRLRIGEILVRAGRATNENVDQILRLQDGEKENRKFGIIAISEGIIKEEDILGALAAQFDCGFITEINVEEMDLTLLENLQLAFCRDNVILPFARQDDKGVLVASYDPLDFETLDKIELVLDRDVSAVLVPKSILTEAINTAFDRKSRFLGADLDQLDEAETPYAEEVLVDINDLLEAEGDDEAPVIGFVNSLFVQSVRERASDIHIEPGEKEIVVRFRIDGVLKVITNPPKRFHASIVTRIKIMAGLNIAEKRLPQDGRIRIKMAGKDIDIRVATAPMVHGERVTMRLLDKSALMLNVRDIGFAEHDLSRLLKLIYKPNGIILVTGPTGSGKTTTLYSSLSEINRPDRNIMTIEDPVEYQLQGINQMQVNAKIDLTFATGLRSYLRHDPDIIMVGEIRDTETADMAIQASLTGHLVFSTLHTNDAAGAFTRLSDMRVQPFLVASSVIAALAQRLVRRLCKDCKVAYDPTDEDIGEIGLKRETLLKYTTGGTIYQPQEGGCEECNHVGYRGRTGIYELLEMNEEIKQLIIKNSDAGTIKRAAVRNGMHTLQDDGALKVMRGITSIAEVMRVTSEGGGH